MKRRRLWTELAVPLPVLGVVFTFGYVALFGGDDAETKAFVPPEPKASAAAKAEAARMPACTGEGKPTNFAFYTLGPRFAGVEQSKSLRRCDLPDMSSPGSSMSTAGGKRHAFRANYASVIYGDCEAGDDEGCAPPLEIQTWPACERNAGTYEKAKRPNLRIRGAPAVVFDGGTQIEIYTARATVVVFGADSALTKRAARAVARQDPGTRFPSKVTAAGVSAASRQPLARPARGAMAGRLDCRPVSASTSGAGA